MKCSKCKTEVLSNINGLCGSCAEPKQKPIFRGADKGISPDCIHVETGWCPICKSEWGCVTHGPECTCGMCNLEAGGAIQTCAGIDGCDCPGCRHDLWLLKEAPDYDGRVAHRMDCSCGVCVVGGTGVVFDVLEHDSANMMCTCPKCCPLNYRWHTKEAVDAMWRDQIVGKPICKVVLKESEPDSKEAYDAQEHVDNCSDPKCMSKLCVDKRLADNDDLHVSRCVDVKCLRTVCTNKRLAEPAKQIADLRADTLPIVDEFDIQNALKSAVGGASELIGKAIFKPVNDAVAAETAKRMEKIRAKVSSVMHNMLLSKADYESGNAKLSYICRCLEEIWAEISGDYENSTISDDSGVNSTK